ncbi:unnamed protein product [Blepharisma stoltei]|uniref:Uncharacterized protein n=1 Tax=Blepharisma stoltei TaxID=1481888 RepID=A0AAU9JPS0_9CILI|nr:unnamed protein product [Blepharisma stoltei]
MIVENLEMAGSFKDSLVAFWLRSVHICIRLKFCDWRSVNAYDRSFLLLWNMRSFCLVVALGLLCKMLQFVYRSG